MSRLELLTLPPNMLTDLPAGPLLQEDPYAQASAPPPSPTASIYVAALKHSRKRHSSTPVATRSDLLSSSSTCSAATIITTPTDTSVPSISFARPESTTKIKTDTATTSVPMQLPQQYHSEQQCLIQHYQTTANVFQQPTTQSHSWPVHTQQHLLPPPPPPPSQTPLLPAPRPYTDQASLPHYQPPYGSFAQSAHVPENRYHQSACTSPPCISAPPHSLPPSCSQPYDSSACPPYASYPPGTVQDHANSLGYRCGVSMSGLHPPMQVNNHSTSPSHGGCLTSAFSPAVSQGSFGMHGSYRYKFGGSCGHECAWDSGACGKVGYHFEAGQTGSPEEDHQPPPGYPCGDGSNYWYRFQEGPCTAADKSSRAYREQGSSLLNLLKGNKLQRS